jgi:hypothetical protein
MTCQQCGKRPATHFCTGCGKWICDSPVCAARSAVDTLKAKVSVLKK